MTTNNDTHTTCDVLVVGGGPAGLAAALTLGRARKRVLLTDSGPRRNAAATHVYNFLTRDGTPPDEMRRVAREQLAHYPNVAVRDVGVRAIAGEKGAFTITLDDDRVIARRVILATGMIDEPIALEGFAALWGRSIFQCPYCHGWEAQGGRWGVLALHPEAPHTVPFATMLRGWSDDVTLYTHGTSIDGEPRARLEAAGVTIETTPIARLVDGPRGLSSIALEDGRSIACETLFAHPHQRQVEVVRSLALALDDDGMLKVDPMTKETSVPGIHAAGDLATRGQGAILAAAAGMQAAAAINMELTAALVSAGRSRESTR
ncbi:MAG: NAD(P)/FAD-dependent oxidoreductase [Deltaproteobacteria bacterium]|nr:NAD(P)/FAD-dependent oxidoreductase [Deltaproteobacteria bacterium]